MLTKAEQGEVYRVWGHCRPARELIKVGISQTDYVELQKRYKEVHIVGPRWDNENGVWTVYQRFSTHRVASIPSSTIKRFLDVSKTAQSFIAYRC